MNPQTSTPLGQLARLIRSKNAGPWTLTIDVMLRDSQTYGRVVASGVLAAERVGPLLGVDPQSIDVFHYAPANTVKLSFPRRVPNGHPEDTDIFGGQQFAPLVALMVPALENEAVPVL
jgi:hypothetical protein